MTFYYFGPIALDFWQLGHGVHVGFVTKEEGGMETPLLEP